MALVLGLVLGFFIGLLVRPKFRTDKFSVTQQVIGVSLVFAILGGLGFYLTGTTGFQLVAGTILWGMLFPTLMLGAEVRKLIANR